MENSRFNNWIFNSYSPTAEGLALYRIFAALLFLLFLLPDTGFYTTLSNMPSGLYTPPPGPMELLNSFPPEWFFLLLHAVLVISWVGILIGYQTKWASITAGVTMLMLQGFMFSLGKINHEILLALTPILMAFSNWGAVHSVDEKLGRSKGGTKGWPLVLLALFIGFMMFTAGFPKILGGWLDPSTQATRGHLFNQFFVNERRELFAEFAVRFDAPFVWEFLDWATIIFEVGFLAAVWKAKWTRLFVCFAVVFHFSTMMTLNIAFLVNFLAYAAFIKWDSVYRFFEKNVTLNITVLGVAISMIALRIASDRGVLMSPAEPALHELVFLSLALVIVTALGALHLNRAIKNRTG